MSELKAYKFLSIDEIYPDANLGSDYYLKSEADKVIAELEESHKKEVEQLLIEIEELKHSLELASNECCIISERGVKNARHHKYKRCLAMTKEWRSYAAFCGIQSSWHNNRGFGKTAEKWTWKECHAWRCVKRWRELAEKFKEAK